MKRELLTLMVKALKEKSAGAAEKELVRKCMHEIFHKSCEIRRVTWENQEVRRLLEEMDKPLETIWDLFL